ncbi:MAG TPA: hypothetical protein VK250_11535 [Nitrososphaeraceae archaeon]|nr:hypothetical protein [Nitrososphaeraceae archaeon]
MNAFLNDPPNKKLKANFKEIVIDEIDDVPKMKFILDYVILNIMDNNIKQIQIKEFFTYI